MDSQQINKINAEYFQMDADEYVNAQQSALENVAKQLKLPEVYFDMNGYEQGNATPDELFKLAADIGVAAAIDNDGNYDFWGLFDKLNDFFIDDYRDELNRRSHYTAEGIEADTNGMKKGDVRILDCNFTSSTEWGVEVMKLDDETFAFRTNTPLENGNWKVGEAWEVGQKRESIWYEFCEFNEEEEQEEN